MVTTTDHMTRTAALILPSERETWPQAIDPYTKRAFRPSFLYRTGSGHYWTISTETDRRGRLAGSVDFNPAAEPQWVAVEMNDETASAAHADGL